MSAPHHAAFARVRTDADEVEVAVVSGPIPGSPPE
jgi:hypothetical protein